MFTWFHFGKTIRYVYERDIDLNWIWNQNSRDTFIWLYVSKRSYFNVIRHEISVLITLWVYIGCNNEIVKKCGMFEDISFLNKNTKFHFSNTLYIGSSLLNSCLSKQVKYVVCIWAIYFPYCRDNYHSRVLPLH
jgi:hypothetical protein